MNLNEIPEKFETNEELNRIWHLIQDENNQKTLKAIDATNLSKRINEAKNKDDRKFYNQVFSSILEIY